MTAPYHVPVLANAVLEHAAGVTRVVDATAGGGGHTALFLSEGMQVLAIDRDPDAVAVLNQRFSTPDVHVLQGEFDAPAVLEEARAFQPDGVLLDLGVSSHQLDDVERGFTFKAGARLDMRMGRSGESAADYLNRTSPEDLSRTLRDYADERRARPLAREIVRRRAREPFETSEHLVNAIRAVLGPSSGPSDFARIFQAVRIAVNEELERLQRALPAYRDLLRPGGVMQVITYHSGEDRIVKHMFRDWGRACVCPEGMPICTCRGRPLGTVVTRKPIMAETGEVEHNVRARSARLRVFQPGVE